MGVLGAMFILRILGSGLSDDWGAETSPSSGHNHMHRHLLSGSMGKEKKKCSCGNLSLGGIVYLAIPGCIRCVNSHYFKFDKVYF